MELQKSRYMLIDTSEKSLRRQALMQAEQMANLDKYTKTSIVKNTQKSIEDKPLNYRFCHHRQVNNNQQLNISFK